MRRLCVLLLTCGLLVLVLTACGGASDVAGQSQEESTAKDYYLIGDTQEFRSRTITVLNANNDWDSDRGVGILGVELEVTSTSTIEEEFSPYDCGLEEKLTHETWDVASSTIGDTPLAPGETRDGWVYFEADGPPSEYLFSVSVPTNGISGAEQLIWILDPPGTEQMEW